MYKVLKRTRVVVSLLFIIAITASFIYFVNRESSVFSFFLKLQFVPSMLGVFSGGALVFGFLLILTLLFGRIYCSTLCPMGTFQDIVTKIASMFKSKKARRFKYSSANKLRYVTLVIVFLFLVAGISLPLGYLDPYSAWGRISSEVISRSEQLIHNGVSLVFPDAVYFRSYSHFTTASFFFALSFLILVGVFSSMRGRLYCNTICPVGAFLGLVSKAAIFRPTINKSLCTKCQLCVLKCKSQCIDLKEQTIDASRCVGCFDCMEVCKNGGISYQFAYSKTQNENTSPVTVSKDRRSALIAMGLLGTALASKAMNLGPVISSKPRITGIAPPGALSTEHLLQNCTACHACIAACPNNIIKPATTEYGLDGVLFPVLNFDKHFCSYECNECSKVCPNNAIMPIALEEKKVTQVGQVRFFLERCIVYTDGTDCGACDEHCPTKAITMVPYGDSPLYIPSVDVSFCIGCGACEYICPAVPLKAMIVHALPVQGTAQAPTLDKQEKIEVDDFGF